MKTQQAEPAQSRERRGLRVRCSSQSALGPYTLLGRGRCVRRHALCAAMGLGAWQQTWRHLRERVSVHSLTPCVRRGALTRLWREWKRRNPVNAPRAGGWDERVGALFCTLKYADHAGDCVVHTSVSLIALVVLDGEAKRMPRNPEQSCRVLACEYGCCACAGTTHHALLGVLSGARTILALRQRQCNTVDVGEKLCGSRYDEARPSPSCLAIIRRSPSRYSRLHQERKPA